MYLSQHLKKYKSFLPEKIQKDVKIKFIDYFAYWNEGKGIYILYKDRLVLETVRSWYGTVNATKGQSIDFQGKGKKYLENESFVYGIQKYINTPRKEIYENYKTNDYTCAYMLLDRRTGKRQLQKIADENFIEEIINEKKISLIRLLIFRWELERIRYDRVLVKFLLYMNDIFEDFGISEKET